MQTPSTFSLKILRDDNPQNPFTEWDCEPTLMYRYDQYTTHYGAKNIVSELLSLITDRRLVLNRKELLDALDTKDEDEIREYRCYNQSFADAFRDELIGNDDNLDLVEALAKIARVPYSRHDSRGYSQGDYADALIILTSSWFQKVGANPKHSDAILKHIRELFDAYSWGDVYGYQLIEHKPLYKSDGTLSDTTDDEIIDSCFGFYGDDFDTNGLRDAIPQAHRHLIDDAKNNIQ